MSALAPDADTEIRWIWGDTKAHARTVAPGEAVSFTVAAVFRLASAATTNVIKPTVTGTARQGKTLTGDAGTWSGGTPLTSYALRWLRCDGAGAGCAEIAGATKGAYVTKEADVGHRLRLRVTPDDGAAAYSAATAAIAAPDVTAPVITGPFSTFGGPLTADATTAPMRTTWSASDPSGVCAYAVERSVDGGAYAPVKLAGKTSTSVVEPLSRERTYSYRVTASDCAGNASAPKTGAVVRVDLHDDAAPSVAFGGRWSAYAASYGFAGTLHSTTEAGARASLSAPMRRVALFARPGPDRGAVKVYIDGVLDATLDLYATATANRALVYQHAFASTAEHAVAVENAATAGRPRFEADAFATLR